MKTIVLGLAVALLATTAGAATAASSIGLSTNYSVGYVRSIQTREAGAVAYNWDTQKLMVVGDENNWDEYDLNGGLSQLVLSGYRDPEGLAYIGGGQFAVAQERDGALYKASDLGINGAYRNYSTRQTSPYLYFPYASSASTGMEGVSYERSTGDYYIIREDGPQGIWRVRNADYATHSGDVDQPFDIETLGLETISDISVLSNPLAFAGEGFTDNLLILSATSELLLEVTKAGQIVSAFNLHGIGVNKIEGVTLDDADNIYLVGEEYAAGGSGIIKLSRTAVAAVPEPATWAMLITGFAMVGSTMRRRKTAIAFA